MPFFRAPYFLQLLYPTLNWRIKTESKEIYLTFDDGPVPGPTEFVLDELKKNDAQATFFCIGDNVKKHPDVFQKITGQGHAVGNHTFHHLSGWKTKKGKYIENIRQCHEEIVRLHPDSFRMAQPLFRPPYGRIKRSQISLLKQYQIIMWDVLTHDYLQSLSPEDCLKGAIQATRPGSIVVFHDSLKAERNMKYALPRYLTHFKNLGFTFKVLS
ncbi:MAG TPA: polysaccharide deacetylase family protein [Cyclobacteriaceae bacterium]|nr:polysaccharide deacetylase family protein [Cyclobacteriaceae bacterium]